MIQTIAQRQQSKAIPSLLPVTQEEEQSDLKLDLQNPQTREMVLQELGIEPPKKKVGLFGRLTGLLDAFRFTDDIRKAQKTGNILSGIADFVMDAPKAVGTLITGNEYKDETDREGGKEILESLGVKNKYAKSIGGLALDILGDPTTFITLGSTAGSKVLVAGTPKALTKPGAKLFKETTSTVYKNLAESSTDDIVKFLAKEGITDIAVKKLPQGGLRQVAERVALGRMDKLAKGGVRVFDDLGGEALEQIAKEAAQKGVFDKGGLKFMGKRVAELSKNQAKVADAYINPIGAAHKGLTNIPVIGKKVQSAEQGVGEAFGKGASLIKQLFSRKAQVTGDNVRFHPLYEAFSQADDYLGGQSMDVQREFSKFFKDVVESTDTPEIIPHLIEDFPVEKWDKLPKELQEKILKATDGINPSGFKIAEKSVDVIDNFEDPVEKTYALAAMDAKNYDDWVAKLNDPKSYVRYKTDAVLNESTKLTNKTLEDLTQSKLPPEQLKQAVQDLVNRTPETDELYGGLMSYAKWQGITGKTEDLSKKAEGIIEQVGKKVDEELVPVYHGGAGVNELKKKFEILTPEEKAVKPSSNMGLTGLSMTTKKDVAKNYSRNIGGTEDVYESFINPNAKILKVDLKGNGVDEIYTDDEINALIKEGYDAIWDTSKEAENEFRALTANAITSGEPVRDLTKQITDPLLEEARKFKSAEEFIKAHEAADLMDLSNPQQHRVGRLFSESGDGQIMDTTDVVKEYGQDIKYYPNAKVPSVKSPDSKVTIYRGTVKAQTDILPGDFVTFSKDYALSHNNGENLLQLKVPAKDVIWQGNDFNEWVYSPKTIREKFSNGLSDIWDQAQRTSDSVIGYKSADDFVDAMYNKGHFENIAGQKAKYNEEIRLANLWNQAQKQDANVIKGVGAKTPNEFAESIGTKPTTKLTIEDYKQYKSLVAQYDPKKVALNEFKKSVSFVDKQGVRQEYWQPVFSDSQQKVLAEYDIYSLDDLVETARQKGFKKIRSTESMQTITEEAPIFTRMQLGKHKDVKALRNDLESWMTKNKEVIEKVTKEYKQESLQAQRMGMNINEWVNQAYKEYGDEAGKAVQDKVRAYEMLQTGMEEKRNVISNKIDELYQQNIKTTKIKKPVLTPKDSMYEEMRSRLGISHAEFEKRLSAAKKEVIEQGKKIDKVETAFSKIREIKDPRLKRVIDDRLRDIDRNTQDMIDVGAIEHKASARGYVGRQVTRTPSGLDLEKKKGLAGFIGKSPAKKLDPRSVTSQKGRIYDYLVDLIDAGGETNITKVSGKEAAAHLAEQLARDKYKGIAARKFKQLATDMIDGRITDPSGQKLFKTTKEIVESMKDDIPSSLTKDVDTFMQFGKLTDKLKSYIGNKGFGRLKGVGGEIPIFQQADAWFDGETLGVINQIHKQFFDDNAINEVLKLYDKVNNLIKASQTAWFPAFHTRNGFSNIFSNFTAGVTNPKRYTDAQIVQKYGNAFIKNDEKLMKKIGDKVIKLGDGDSMRVSDIFHLAKDNAVIGNTFYSDLSDELLDKGAKITQRINPLSNKFLPSEVGRKVGSAVEENGRLGLFIDRLTKGDDVRSAALKVKEVLFDYSDLSDFEKTVMKRFIPYYTWTRKNAEMQLKMITHQPGKYATMLKSFNEIQEAFTDLDQEEIDNLPEWAKTGVGFITSKDGKATVIKGFGLPHEAFMGLLNDNLLGNLGIVPKTIVEVGTGKNIFRDMAIVDDTDGKQFKDMPKFVRDRVGFKEHIRTRKDGTKYTIYTVDPWAKYYINVLLGRTRAEFTKIGRVTDPETNKPGELINMLTGIKRYEFDMEEEAEKRQREAERQFLDYLVRSGYASEYTSQYIPKDVKQSIIAKIGQQ